MSGSPIVRIEGVTKRFGAITAVDNVDLVIERGELFALLGSSGCGKTTLLRLLAGFETPDAGRLVIDGQDMTGVPPHRRPINMMFQSYALFPHMNVADNVGYGLRREGLPKAEIADTRRRGAGAGAAVGLRRAAAGAALGRPAPARGAGPRAGQAAQAAAARRAAGRPRPQAARGHALRAGAPAGGARPHLRHGDARPGGGDVDGEPAGRHGSRPHRAGRHAARGLRAAALAFRRRFHRHRQHPAASATAAAGWRCGRRRSRSARRGRTPRTPSPAGSSTSPTRAIARSIASPPTTAACCWSRPPMSRARRRRSGAAKACGWAGPPTPATSWMSRRAHCWARHSSGAILLITKRALDARPS